MAELQIRVPFSAWGSGDEWQEHVDDVFDALDEAMESSGAGVADDPDPFEDYLCFYVDGPDVAALTKAVRPVLAEYGLLDRAIGFLTDPEADDMDIGSTVPLSE